jgi:SAM-dependent methyltransferase
MRAINRGQQHEVLGLLGPPSAAALDVVEVGPGPGVLLGLLAARPDVRRVTGGRALARHAGARRPPLAAGIAAGRVEVRAGDAAATGLPSASADLVVSVNTVAIWPDLDAGAAGLRRVLRPGGRLLLSGTAAGNRPGPPGGCCSTTPGWTACRPPWASGSPGSSGC